MTIRIVALAALAIALTGTPAVVSAQNAPPTPGGQQTPGPGPAPTPAPGPAASPYWGAIGFTADGSYSSAWQVPSKAEAEAKVAVGCAKFGRGKCEVVSFPGERCVGLATYVGSHSRKRWQLSYTAGGTTTPGAQKAALDRCNADPNARNRCQLKTVVCGDGR